MRRLIFFSLMMGFASTSITFYNEGESAALECSAEDGNDVLYWFLHGKGNAIKQNTARNDIYMNSNGSLQFDRVSRQDHEGSHVCIVSYRDEIVAHTVQMDVKPLPPSNLWEAQYRGMFLTGFVAAFVCLALFAGFCLVHKYRWRKPLSKVENPNLVNNAYENPIMVEDGEESIKM